MSFVLKSVEVSNIRSHEHFLFEPLTDGVTALVGPSGSGKSTVVDSFAWALYGTKPSGVTKNSSLIRIGAELPSDKVWVKVELEFTGFTMRLERRIVNKGGSTECDVWEKNVDEDTYRHVAGPAVSHSEGYLRRRLKMEESGFLSAFFIQQKRVDQLISATPRERAEVIEKLTGVSAITTALTEAKNEYNYSKKNLSSGDFDVDAAERRRRELEKTSASSLRKREQLERLEEKVSEGRVNVRQSTEKLREAEERSRRSSELSVSIEHATRLREELKDRLQATLESKSRLKDELDGVELVTDVDQVRRRRDSLASQLRDANSRRFEVERDRRLRETRRSEASETITRFKVADRASLVSKLEDYTAKAVRLEGTITETKAKLDATAATLAVKVEQLDTVSSLDGNCPTCLQPVTDAGHIEKDLGREIEAKRHELEELESRLESLESSKVKADEVKHQLDVLTEAFDTLDETVEPDGEGELLSRLNEQVDELEGLLKDLDRSVDRFSRVESMRAEYDRLRKESETLSDRIEKGNVTIDTLTEESKKLGERAGRVESVVKLKDQVTRHEEQLKSDESKANDLKVEVSVLQEREVHLTRQVEQDEEASKKHSDKLLEIETKASTIELLNEFRRNRVRMSVPVVSTYASTLLSRFSDGEFTRLELDEKFTATITRKDGEQLPVGLLSGGELSLAAISLRIAISLLLNGNSNRSCLVLDEILVSQDAARSELTLSTLREVCKGQVILISHGSNTTDVADKVVELG